MFNFTVYTGAVLLAVQGLVALNPKLNPFLTSPDVEVDRKIDIPRKLLHRPLLNVARNRYDKFDSFSLCRTTKCNVRQRVMISPLLWQGWKTRNLGTLHLRTSEEVCKRPQQSFISMLLLCLLLSCAVASLAINAGLDSTAASKFWRSKARDEFAFKVDKGTAALILSKVTVVFILYVLRV